MKKEGQRIILYVVIGMVLVLAVWMWGSGQQQGMPETSSSPTTSVSASKTPTVKKTPVPTASSLPQSYNDALATYASRRMQFDAYCQAVPQRISMSAGQSVMIDNRSGDARTFAVGGVFFTLPGYGWRIFTPTAVSLPATIYLDCGSSRNVGTIILQ